MVFLHNLADKPMAVDLPGLAGRSDRPREVFADGPYAPVASTLRALELRGYGYRWIRLRRSNAG